ncbi:MAG: 5-deoxy-glucuronate isomerase [candidate division WOR-3 bacterium]
MNEKSGMKPYAVQILMDGDKLRKAFLLEDRTIFLIPGGIHPVVASPFTEVLYVWGIAGYGTDLLMRDVPEFAHLKKFEEMLKLLEQKGLRQIGKEELSRLCKERTIPEDKRRLFASLLREKGYTIID